MSVIAFRYAKPKRDQEKWDPVFLQNRATNQKRDQEKWNPVFLQNRATKPKTLERAQAWRCPHVKAPL